jgi:hypothetical protein
LKTEGHNNEATKNGEGGETMNQDWRKRHWFQALIVLEVVVSVVMLIIGYITGSGYFRGVGVGLLIAWVTGAVAYVIVGAPDAH